MLQSVYIFIKYLNMLTLTALKVNFVYIFPFKNFKQTTVWKPLPWTTVSSLHQPNALLHQADLGEHQKVLDAEVWYYLY